MRFLICVLVFCAASGAVRAQAEPANPELAAELAVIHSLDQDGRMEWMRIRKEHDGRVPHAVHEEFWSVQNKLDEANTARIAAIIAEHGWPGRSMVGEDGARTVFLVVQHAPLERQEEYLPLLEAAVASGEAEAWQLAMLTDRILVRNDLPQRYGSQYRNDPETGERVYLPMEDPDGLDARRAAIGLPPLDDDSH